MIELFKNNNKKLQLFKKYKIQEQNIRKFLKIGYIKFKLFFNKSMLSNHKEILN